jgi:hypothetical protein
MEKIASPRHTTRQFSWQISSEFGKVEFNGDVAFSLN